MPLYAENGIVEVWLIDISDRSLTLYRQPTQQGYRTIEILKDDRNISPLLILAEIVNWDEIFGG